MIDRGQRRRRAKERKREGEQESGELTNTLTTGINGAESKGEGKGQGLAPGPETPSEHKEACSCSGIGESLASGLGGEVQRGGPWGLEDPTGNGGDGRCVLWREGADLRTHQEDRGGRKRVACLSPPPGDFSGVGPQGSLSGPPTGLPGASMLGWMQPDGDRRSVCSRVEGSVGSSTRSGGRMDEEPRKRRSSRSRRATTFEGQGRNVGGSCPKGGGDSRGPHQAEEKVSERRFELGQQIQEEEVEEEEKEEGEEREGLEVNGEAPQLCGSKRTGRAVQGNRIGRQGEDQEACGAQGQALCIEEEEVSQQLLRQLGSIRQFQPCRGYPSSWRFLRRFACKRYRRTLSWSLDVGGPTEDGGKSPNSGGGDFGGRCGPSSGHSILQTTAAEKGFPSGGEGAVDHCSGLGPDCQRHAGASNRYPCPTSQVSGSGGRRSSLVSGSEDGATTIRGSSFSRRPRAETCSTRELREQQVPLLCFEPYGERTGHQNRERREGWEEQRREGQGWQGSQRGEGQKEVEVRKEEEGIQEYEDGLLVKKVSEEVQAPMARDELSGVVAGQVGVVKLPIGGHDNVSPCVAKGATAGMQDVLLGIPPTSGKKRAFECELHGMVQGVTLTGLGNPILQRLLEVCLLRSKSMGIGEGQCLFPLPTSSSTLQKVFPDLSSDEVASFCVVWLFPSILFGETPCSTGGLLLRFKGVVLKS